MLKVQVMQVYWENGCPWAELSVPPTDRRALVHILKQGDLKHMWQLYADTCKKQNESYGTRGFRKEDEDCRLYFWHLHDSQVPSKVVALQGNVPIMLLTSLDRNIMVLHDVTVLSASHFSFCVHTASKPTEMQTVCQDVNFVRWIAGLRAFPPLQFCDGLSVSSNKAFGTFKDLLDDAIKKKSSVTVTYSVTYEDNVDTSHTFTFKEIA